MSKIKSNKFIELSLEQIPRLLGQLNRNPSSVSYGSFDRAYWHYRTNDISCARYQEAVYTLVLLYCSDVEGNNYFQDKKLLEYIRASFCFTAGLQRRNGSFDEWYINEGSYVATAFLVAALSESIDLFRKNKVVIEEEEELILGVLERAAIFLIRASEQTVMNQVSGAIFAIASVGKLRNNDFFIETAQQLLNHLMSLQSPEGWWMEYGGPDIGYLTLTISYLEKYQKLSITQKNFEPLTESIQRAKYFVEKFIAPDVTAGGEYMSRNTEYIIPSETLPYLGAITPTHLDDRYLCYVLYNWIYTGLIVAPQKIPVLVNKEEFLNECGILRVVNESYFLVVNGKKGGSLRLYSKDKNYYDSAVEVSSHHGNFSAGILDDANQISFRPGSLHVSGFVKCIKEPLLKTALSVAFKVWQLLFGRFSFLQRSMKKFLRPQMISYSNRSGIAFERNVEYGSRVVAITDIVIGAESRNAILLEAKSAYSAVPSSKYALAQEFAVCQMVPVWDEKKDGDTYTIKRTFSFD